MGVCNIFQEREKYFRGVGGKNILFAKKTQIDTIFLEKTLIIIIYY
jgi:hypothetical protein